MQREIMFFVVVVAEVTVAVLLMLLLNAEEQVCVGGEGVYRFLLYTGTVCLSGHLVGIYSSTPVSTLQVLMPEPASDRPSVFCLVWSDFVSSWSVS